MKTYTFKSWLVVLAGWVNLRRQQDVIAYLQEENRVYREMLGPKRLRLDRKMEHYAQGARHGGTMVTLRERMTGDMQLRRFAVNPQQSYLRAVADLARHYRRPPVQLKAQG